MKKTILFPAFAACALMFVSCKDAEKKDTPEAAAVSATAPAEPAKPDMAKIKADIQAVENTWADLQTKKDLAGLMALYADDATSMQDGGPALVGKADIQKQQEADFAGPRKYASIAFETADVYGDGDYVTEVGKTIYKDAAGKSIGSGKYMVVFVKKDGKYLCLREIYNRDSK